MRGAGACEQIDVLEFGDRSGGLCTLYIAPSAYLPVWFVTFYCKTQL